MSKIDFSPALQLLQKSKSVLLTTHLKPDGDALGSAAGLALILGSKGKSTQIVLPSPLPAEYAFLFGCEPPRVICDDWCRHSLQEFDTVVILDTSVESQLQPQFQFLRACPMQILVIDHHLTTGSISTVQIIDPTASAVGLLVAELAHAWQISLGPPAAQALFTAIATDTGWFRFPNTDARTFRQAASLLQAGAELDRIYQTLYMKRSPAKLKLLGRTIDSLQLLCRERLACMTLRQTDFQQTHATLADTEDLINEPLRIGSVIAAVLFVEQQDGSTRLSLRSKGPLDVAQIARQFGGGGHKLAAGAQLPTPLEQTRQTVLPALERQISALGGPAT